MTYERINRRFEKAVIQLQENLQYLANNDKVSNRYINMQNLIINSLVDFQQYVEQYISTLEMENLGLAKTKVLQIEKLKDTQVMLEAVCIIHGVLDFPMWMAKGKYYLIQEAISCYQDNSFQIPDKIHKKIQQLSVTEKKVLHTLMNKAYYESQEELQKQLQAFKTK